MNCPKCGELLGDGVKFCSKCGQGLQQAKSSTGLTEKLGANKPNKKRRLFSWITLAIIGVFILGCYATSSSDSKGATVMKAMQLAEEFKKDTNSANGKYKDKTVKVSGQVLKKGQFTNSDHLFVSLYDKDNAKVLVDFALDQKSKVNELKEGDFIEVQGLCVGTVPQKDKNIISVQLQDAKISK